MWQKVQVKCNLKEAHSFPYWREANFRTRICESCDKKFMSSAILKNHIVFHTGEKPFSGPEFVNPVKKVHVNWNLWEAHSLPHWRKAIFRTRICESCDKKFMPRGILKKHIVFHSGEKPSSCANSLMQLSGGSHMESHIEADTGEKPYKRKHCKLCDNCFTEAIVLKIHKFCHSGEKPLRS